MRRLALFLTAALCTPSVAYAQLAEYGQIDNQFFTLKAGPQGGTPNILTLAPSFVNSVCGTSAGCFTGFAINSSGNLSGTSQVDEDDISGLQAYVNNTINNPALQGASVLPPASRPSGYYNICAASIVVPNRIFQTKIILDFSQAKIRVLPGCNPTGMINSTGSGPTNETMLYIPFAKGGGSGYNQQDYDQLTVKAYLDGWGIAQSNIWNNTSLTNFQDTTLRNVAGGLNNTNANFVCAGGGEITFTGRNQFGNYNDPAQAGSPFYPAAGTYPMANWYNISCHDSFIGTILAINATYANFYDLQGSGMYYSSMQGYGNKSGSDPYGNPCYNFAVTDSTVSLRDTYAGNTNGLSACPGVAGTPPSAGIFIGHAAPFNGASSFHSVEVFGGFNLQSPYYGVLGGYGAQYTLKDYNFQGNASGGACVGQYDSGGTVQTTSGAWFSPYTQIGGNQNCTLTVGTQNEATQDLLVNGNLTVNNEVISGMCPTLPFTNGGTVSISTGSSCAIGSGSGTLTSATLQLPNAAATGCALPIAGYRFFITVSPIITTLNVEDGCGGNSDVIGTTFSMAGNKTLTAVVNAARTAWVVGS